MIAQFGILFLFLGLGELTVWLTGIPIPSSIIGMLLMFFSLSFKIIKLSNVDKVADFLVNHLGFFFIPAGIGVMKYFNLITAQWFPILMAVVISTVLIILCSGGIFEMMQTKAAKFKKSKIAR